MAVTEGKSTSKNSFQKSFFRRILETDNFWRVFGAFWGGMKVNQFA